MPDVQYLVVALGWRGGKTVGGGLAGPSTTEADEALKPTPETNSGPQKVRLGAA